MSNDEMMVKIYNKMADIEDKVNGMVTKKEFDERISTLTSNVDRFVTLHEKLDTERVSMLHKYDRLENRVETLEQKIGVSV